MNGQKNQSPNNLPLPDPESKQHSMQLLQLIQDRIQQGPFSFADYMQTCLYEPGLGYYSAGCEKFGPQGDFVTAPSMTPLFAQCLGQQCLEVLAPLQGGSILEFGAGGGELAQGILDFLEQHGQLPENYFILEVSAQLQQRQRAYLQQHAPQHVERIHWLSQLPENFKGIILANEVMDAMPVERFHISQDGHFQLVVGCEDDTLSWKASPPQSKKLNEKIQTISQILPADCLRQGYTSEINLTISPWIASLSQCLSQGVILLIDYGFPEAEYYHPQRNEGTLMCHFQHYAHGDPLIYPGIQDITAHVNFTDVAQAATDNQLDILGFCNQAAFLLSLGLLEKTDNEDFRAKQQVKRLTMPHEMGELFKVIALGKQVEQSLTGFTIQNQSYRLAPQEIL